MSSPPAWAILGPVTVGTQQHESPSPDPEARAGAVAELDHLRAAVADALTAFLTEKRETLAGMSPGPFWI